MVMLKPRSIWYVRSMTIVSSLQCSVFQSKQVDDRAVWMAHAATTAAVPCLPLRLDPGKKKVDIWCLLMMDENESEP
ncbi:unnamed protein product, partial [Musa textilis]